MIEINTVRSGKKKKKGGRGGGGGGNDRNKHCKVRKEEKKGWGVMIEINTVR